MTRKPADPVVPAAGTTLFVDIPATGRNYTLRAPTFGEVGEMTARALTAAQPSDAVFAEALRKAAEAGEEAEADRIAAVEVVDAHEDAQDHLDSLYAAHGPDRAAWSDDARREIASAQRALFTAQRARLKLEWRYRDHAGLAELRRHQIDARQREALDLVALCVVSVDGKLADLTPEGVAALPAGDVSLLAERAQALVRPTQAAEKN